MLTKHIFFFCTIFASLPAYSSTKPIIQALTVSDNFPYNFVKNGEIQGIGFDAITELVKRMDMEIKIHIVPWSRAYLTAKRQPNILLFSIEKSPEWMEDFFWIGPISHSEIWFYKLKVRSDIVVKRLEDIKRYKVGLVNYNSMISEFRRIGIEVDTAPDEQSNCRKLMHGRVDFVMVNSKGVDVFLGMCGLEKDDVERSIFMRSAELYIVLGKDSDPNLVTLIREKFLQIHHEKILQRINTKWLDGNVLQNLKSD